MDYSPPYSWCDSSCDRCPLQKGCPVYMTLRARREEHEQRGENPDDPGVFMEDMASDLTEAMKLLEKEARKRGVGLDHLPEPMEPPPDIARLQDVAMQHANSIKGLVDGLSLGEQEACGELANQALSKAFLLTTKAARITGTCTEEGAFEDQAVYHHDTVPNLLLMEHAAQAVDMLMAELSSAAPSLCLDRYRSQRGEMHKLLDPLLAGIPADERVVFEALEAAGKAPSPFCTTG